MAPLGPSCRRGPVTEMGHWPWAQDCPVERLGSVNGLKWRPSLQDACTSKLEANGMLSSGPCLWQTRPGSLPGSSLKGADYRIHPPSVHRGGSLGTGTIYQPHIQGGIRTRVSVALVCLPSQRQRIEAERPCGRSIVPVSNRSSIQG